MKIQSQKEKTTKLKGTRNSTSAKSNPIGKKSQLAVHLFLKMLINMKAI